MEERTHLMQRFTHLLLIAGVMLCTSFGYGQGYRISVDLNAFGDSTVYLANYFGSKLYYADTTIANKKGVAVFEGKEALPGGKYAIVVPGPTYFEVLVDEDQDFDVETDSSDYIMNFSVKGSEANQLYYDYVQFINRKKAEVGELNEELSEFATDSVKSLEITTAIVDINKSVQEEQRRIMKEYPDNWAAKVIGMSVPVDIPEAPKDENGVITDSLFQYRYYLDHYFDHVPLKDAKIVRTPEFDRKLTDYFTSALLQHPDTMSKYADQMLAEVEYDEDLFKFVTHFCTYNFETSKVMGMDAAFVHMVENYYMTGKATWMDSTSLAKVTERAMRMKPTLLGNKAPFMRLHDTTGTRFTSLYDVQADWTVVYIWDPECGHCKKENPKMVDFYERFKDRGVKVYSVGNPHENEEWIEYLREHEDMNQLINVSDSPEHPSPFRTYYDVHSTPVVLLLDKEKKIVAKKVGVEQLEQILERKMNESENKS